jgi:hypothetical protein
VSPPKKPVTDPLLVAGSEAIVGFGLKDRLDPPTITGALRELSAPDHAPCLGTIAYVQIPEGTPFSVQLDVVTVPAQAPPAGVGVSAAS